MRGRSATPGVGAVIGWTLLSAFVPGSAHLRAGWRRTGYALLGVYALLVVGAVVLALSADFASLLGRLTSAAWLNTIMIATMVVGLGWFAVVVHSFVVLRPGLLPTKGQIAAGITAGLVAVAAILPFGLVTQYVSTSDDLLDHVFDTPDQTQAQPIKPEDPWNGQKRVNILLLGGDADDHRPGVRTDSINLASVDVETGNTVLFSLPRNLENVRFPPGSPMRAQFPNGFRLPPDPGGGRSDLLFAVWQYADSHPEIFGGKKNQGAKTLKETIGYTLNLKVDYYALVNMWGFARLIDAIGGVVIHVDRDVVFGKYNEGLVKAGTRRLKGADAMWFARSRTYSDDYTRMRRQRCVLGALLEQADPATVLTNFNRVAAATKTLLRTDIPRPLLEHLVPLALKVQKARVTSVQFVPPLINTGYPDWAKIRTVAAKAIAASEKAGAPITATTSASPVPTPTASATGKAKSRPKAAKTPKPTQNGDSGFATGLTEGC
ncbi:LCP family protein required for cell wall assembly [Thermocatellispora tengchongensis]|uniref:LCP family protein required for cell wall assembly n=1 Tax=Thermocatellispora tengchongensis TaxID=1073253 RepID=A0A840NUD4_9ACTN|nr:LCP family protein [Thermocatellispora tengchongensis]MBB5131168.1 LCP family protein required for cell wall assembly [Thermocatellispora tengchongensis]